MSFDPESVWLELCEKLALNLEVNGATTWWNFIATHYNEERRSYHTLCHIKHLLQQFSKWKSLIKDKDVIMLAIFFHDVIYDPKAKDNELKSIIAFKKFAEESNLSLHITEQVEEMIKATITHSVDESMTDSDLCLFLDFDMAILGEPDEVYDDYATKIRQEYCHFNNQAYANGRTKVLESFLQSEHIFSCSDLRNQLEVQARKNIQREIDRLKSDLKKD